MPQVSVIIPNYNHAPYLKQRIDSVVNQTYQDFEVIILDDCSTDNSRDIIENYRDHPKVSKIIYNENNSGSTFAQWKKGIELAEGDWIWIAESDDWAEITFLDYLTKPFIGYDDINEVSIIYGQSYIYYNDLQEIRTEDFTRKIFEVIGKNDFVEQKLIPRNYLFNASMAIFKKSIFNQISEYYTNFTYCGDWVFWAEMGRKGDVIQIPQYINYFRKHPKSVSLNAMKNYNGLIQDLDAVTYFRDHLNVKENNIILGAAKFLKRYINISAQGLGQDTKKEIEKRFINLMGKKHFYDKKSQLIRSKNYTRSFEYSLKQKIKSFIKIISFR